MAQFSDLTKGVHDAWRFCWPPILAVIVVYVTARIGCPPCADSVQCGLPSSQQLVKLATETRTLLEPFGLSALIPISCTLLLILALYLVEKVAMAVSNNIPPHISYTPYTHVFGLLSQRERKALLRTYPMSSSVAHAYDTALSSLRATSNFERGKSDAYFRLLALVKVSALTSVLIAVYAIAAGFPVSDILLRFAAVIGIDFLVWAASLLGYLYELELVFFAQYQAVVKALNAATLLAAEQPPHPDEDSILEHEEKYPPTGPWWFIRLLNTHRFVWLAKTLRSLIRPQTVRLRK